MKISNRVTTSGGVLVTTLIVCVLIGIMLAAYMSMVSNQHKLSQRSQVWNNCIPMCEVGMEEALAHLNHINTRTNFAINGWVFSGGAYRKDRTWNQGFISIAINTSMPPVITVAGSLRSPVQNQNITRRVMVRTRFNQRFPNAFLAKGGVTLGGMGRVDSFNSTNVLESGIDGQYNILTATDHATVASTATNAGTINVGNVSIYGSVATGPGGTAVVGPGGNVGSTLFNNNPLFDGKIEAGHVTDDVNVYIPDARLPDPFGPALFPTAGIVGGTNYTYVLTNADYSVPSISLGSSDKVIVMGKVRIRVTGPTALTSDAHIIVAPGATIEMYCYGNVNMAGKGVVNFPGFAKNFAIIGLPTCTTVSYSGQVQFCGTIYAPNATVSLTGTAAAYGAFVGRTLSLSGGMSVHYDEALRGNPNSGRFLAASWQEL
jgi:hypothetical protein